MLSLSVTSTVKKKYKEFRIVMGEPFWAVSCIIFGPMYIQQHTYSFYSKLPENKNINNMVMLNIMKPTSQNKQSGSSSYPKGKNQILSAIASISL